MARPGLARHRKFLRLVHALDQVAAPYGELIARGALEALWECAYENGDEYVGDGTDVESIAAWKGKPGALVAALMEAGGVGHAGFIEEGGSEFWADGTPGTYRIHDLHDHAPNYVQRRMAREAERVTKGESIRALRSAAGKKGAEKRWQTDGKCQTVASQRLTNGMANVATPAPAPAQEKPTDSLPLVGLPVVEQKPAKARQSDPSFAALEEALSAAYREVKGEELDWPKSAHGELQAIRKTLADDAEVVRRWRLFLADAYWPIKNVHKFREAFQHAKFQRRVESAEPKKVYPGIPEYR